jgi:hypothetical protein
MPSSWITTRTTRAGGKRYRVEYRLGGREAPTRYGGSFKTKREADERRRWIDGELAGRRVPDLSSFAPTARQPTVAEAVRRWRESRVDVSEGTRVFHRVALDRLLPTLGDRQVDELTVADLNETIGVLSAAGRKPATIREEHSDVGDAPQR